MAIMRNLIILFIFMVINSTAFGALESEINTIAGKIKIKEDKDDITNSLLYLNNKIIMRANVPYVSVAKKI